MTQRFRLFSAHRGGWYAALSCISLWHQIGPRYLYDGRIIGPVSESMQASRASITPVPRLRLIVSQLCNYRNTPPLHHGQRRHADARQRQQKNRHSARNCERHAIVPALPATRSLRENETIADLQKAAMLPLIRMARRRTFSACAGVRAKSSPQWASIRNKE